MPWSSDPDFWGALGALILAMLSGLIAIANRLAEGQKFSWVWLFAQLSGAILVGYLMWDVYPVLKPDLPAWITQPIAVSVAAHYGGKAFSLAEKMFTRKIGLPQERTP